MRIFHDFSKVISFLTRYTRGTRNSKLLVLLVIIIGLISGISNAALIAVINSALTRSGSSAGLLLWGFIGLCLLLPLSRFVSSVLLAYLNSRANFEICTALSRQILSAPLNRLEQIGPHRLLATLTSDINTIGNIMPALPGIVMNAALVVGCLVYMGLLSWTLLLGLIGILIVGLVTYQFAMGRARGYFHFLRVKGDQLVSHYRAITEGTKELKLHANRADSFLSKMLVPTAAEMASLSYKGSYINAAAMGWGALLSFIPIGLLLFAAPSMVTIESGVLSGYILTILYMVGPLQAIMAAIPSISYAGVSVDKIHGLGIPLDPGAIKPSSGRSGPAQSWTRLELAGVSHIYHREEGQFMLGPIDLSFQPGEIVFLTGGNGSGKTTLAKLMTGLYTSESGEIRFNGNPVTDENREAYQQNFTMVFSDFFLFDSLLGLDSPNLDEEAREYLQLLQLSDKVQVKDGQFSTTKLSQGQRKRLALLTAYLEDKPIYLFDEWASDQDPVFRDVFYHQILPGLKARNKTVIVISHDNHYYHVGDRIIRLDYGKLEYDLPASITQRAASGSSALPAD